MTARCTTAPVPVRRLNRSGVCGVVLCLILFVSGIVFAQRMPRAETRGLEEIVVGFTVPRLLSEDLFVLWDGDEVYLPVTEVFGLLDLRIELNLNEGRTTGYVIDQDDDFEFNLVERWVRTDRGRTVLSDRDFAVSRDELYLRRDFFGRLFGLPMEFSFAALEVKLPLNEDFPAYQSLQRREAHKKLRSRETELRDIRFLPRRTQYLAGGALDWAVSATPVGGSGQYANATLGGMILGGDFQVSGGGNTITGFDENQLDYRWHYFYDRSRWLTQIDLGHFSTSGLLSRSVVGGRVSNRPQVPRETFQTVHLSAYVGEDWEVELYRNNELVDFVYTDNSGYYNFTLDLHYGTAEVVLKMYGPNGEMRTERKYIGIPYNLIPAGEFEYDLAAGVEDAIGNHRSYGQVQAAYGIADFLTIGASGDIPMTPGDTGRYGVPAEPTAAATATLKLPLNMTLRGTSSPGFAHSAALSFSRPSLLSLGLSYTEYEPVHYRNPSRMIREAAASISMPIRFGRHYLNAKGAATYNEFSAMRTLNMNYGVNVSLPWLYLGYLGHFKLSEYSSRSVDQITSQAFISPRFFPWIYPQFRVSYDHTENQLTRYGVQFYKTLFGTAQVSVALERNQELGVNQASVSLRFVTGFFESHSRGTMTSGTAIVTQLLRGSVSYDHTANRVRFDRRRAVGMSSAVVRPFMDDNLNGRRDRGETYVSGLKARVEGGRARSVGKQEMYYYDGLRPYDRYLVSIDEYSLDNPLLRPTHRNYRVFCNPNVTTEINVPLVVSAEVSGKVERLFGSNRMGQAGVRVILHHLEKDTKTVTTTFSTGRFYEMGLLPGPYNIYVDPQQLKKGGFRCEPPVMEIEIQSEARGAVIEDLNFIIMPSDHEPISVTPDHGSTPDRDNEGATGSAGRPPAGQDVYVVKRGDTQWSIANKLRVTVDELCRANNMARGETIHVGQRLVIPRKSDNDPTASLDSESADEDRSETARPDGYRMPDSPSTTRHIVEAGETLWSIAQQHGTTVRNLQRLNGLGGTSRLIVGQELVVGGDGQALAVHRVRRGETLYRIARQYDVDMQTIIAVNHLSDPDRLNPGTELRVPVN